MSYFSSYTPLFFPLY